MTSLIYRPPKKPAERANAVYSILGRTVDVRFIANGCGIFTYNKHEVIYREAMPTRGLTDTLSPGYLSPDQPKSIRSQGKFLVDDIPDADRAEISSILKAMTNAPVRFWAHERFPKGQNSQAKSKK